MGQQLLIKNVILCSNNSAGRKTDILVSGGRIERIEDAGTVSCECPSVDGGGLMAIPGLIDIHIHGAGGSDSLDGTRQDFETISRTLSGSGITSFLTTMVVRPGSDNIHLKMAAECTGKDLGGAELLGVHIEGPFISIEKRGGIIPDCITSPSADILDNLLDVAGKALKLMCVAPEIRGISKMIKLLLDNGIRVSFGHSDAGYEDTLKGFDMGISHVTHLFNAMRPLHHRDPGPLAAIFETSHISAELIADSYHVHPSLIKMTHKLKTNCKIVCITDGISGMGLPEGKYRYNDREYISEGGLARYVDGTFIGSTMNLMQILSNFMKFTGCSLPEAIDTVTINPARIAGVENRKGSLEVGKDADIVLITPSLNVSKTIIAGKIIDT